MPFFLGFVKSFVGNYFLVIKTWFGIDSRSGASLSGARRFYSIVICMNQRFSTFKAISICTKIIIFVLKSSYRLRKFINKGFISIRGGAILDWT